VLGVGRGTAADVDRDIEDRPGADPHQLRLRLGLGLEMQPTDDAARYRQRVVFLQETRLDAILAQHRLAKDLGKETARVAMPDRPDFLYFGNCGRNDLHAPAPLNTAQAGGRL